MGVEHYQADLLLDNKKEALPQRRLQNNRCGFRRRYQYQGFTDLPNKLSKYRFSYLQSKDLKTLFSAGSL